MEHLKPVKKNLLLLKVFKSSGATCAESMHLLFQYSMNTDPLFNNDQFNSCFILADKQSTQIHCG